VPFFAPLRALSVALLFCCAVSPLARAEPATATKRAEQLRRLDGIDARLSLGQVYGERATGYAVEFTGVWRFYRDRGRRR
jgi:hypothetical protein